MVMKHDSDDDDDEVTRTSVTAIQRIAHLCL